MEVHVIEGIAERSAISSLCLNTQVLAAIAPGWTPDCFPSKWANIVGGWAAKYYNEYKEAPGVQGITALYADWAAGSDSDTAGIVNKWLTTLDPDQSVNPEYAIGQIQKIITRTALKRMADKITGALSNNKLDAALDVAEAWKRPIAAQQADYLSVFQEIDQIKIELDATITDPIIKYRGALGQFINPLFVREGFVAFLAPAKRGKSTLLMDIGWTAALQGRNVAYFSTGDMSRGQILDRLRVKAAKRPKFPGTYRIPTSLAYEGKEHKVEYRICSASEGLQGSDGVEALSQFASDDRFRIVAKSANTISAGDITAIIHRWADGGWVADVIVIDYADILRGMGSHRELRDQINENWIQMSALRTEMKSLVVTATQADTEGMESWVLSPRMFSQTRQKWDHATAVVGINSTPVEKKAGVFRLNHLLLREGEFASDLPSLVAVAGCTKIGRPIILSEWIK